MNISMNKGLGSRGSNCLAAGPLSVVLCLLLASGSALAGDSLVATGYKVNAGDGMIEHEVVVEATSAQVWTAWTTKEGVEAFFAPQAKVELRIGGAYELYFAPDASEGLRGSEGCTILAYLPREMLAFTWNAPPSIPALRGAKTLTHVVVTFDDLIDDRVRVRLAHLGMGTGEEWDKYRAYFNRAWPSVLNHLREQIGSIKPSVVDVRPDPRLRFELTVDAPVEEVWKAFTTKEGIESWMVPRGEIDLRVGGLMRTNYNREGSFDDPGAIAHRIMSFEPNRMMAFQVVKCPEGFEHEQVVKNTWSVLRLTSAGEGQTHVALAGAGLGEGPEADQMVKFFQAGNEWTLERLRKKFAEE
jgi:uncharacterized protein YndB with AHSA1/START domain